MRFMRFIHIKLLQNKNALEIHYNGLVAFIIDARTFQLVFEARLAWIGLNHPHWLFFQTIY